MPTEEEWWESHRKMEAEAERLADARLAALRAEGKTLYKLFIDEDDTSDGAPELWCITMADTDEVVRRRMSNDELEAFPESHPDWVEVHALSEEIRDDLSEKWVY